MRFLTGLTAAAVLIAFFSCAMYNDSSHYITTPMDGQGVSGYQTIVVTPPQDFLSDQLSVYISSNRQYSYLNLVATIQAPSPFQYEWNTRSYTNAQWFISIELQSQMGTLLTDSISVYVEN